MPVTDELARRRQRAIASGRPIQVSDRLVLPPEATDLASAILVVNAVRTLLIDLGIAAHDEPPE